MSNPNALHVRMVMSVLGELHAIAATKPMSIVWKMLARSWIVTAQPTLIKYDTFYVFQTQLELILYSIEYTDHRFFKV